MIEPVALLVDKLVGAYLPNINHFEQLIQLDKMIVAIQFEWKMELITVILSWLVVVDIVVDNARPWDHQRRW